MSSNSAGSFVFSMLALCLVSAHGASAAQQCIGDCNGDGQVTVNELLRLIPPSSTCLATSTDTVAARIAAVNNALYGCPEAPPAGLSAACSLDAKGGPFNLFHVALIILNASGSMISGVTPTAPLDVRGGTFTVSRVPANQPQLDDGQRVIFLWELSSNAPALTVNAGAIAIAPDGRVFRIGPVPCD